MCFLMYIVGRHCGYIIQIFFFIYTVGQFGDVLFIRVVSNRSWPDRLSKLHDRDLD